VSTEEALIVFAAASRAEDVCADVFTEEVDRGATGASVEVDVSEEGTMLVLEEAVALESVLDESSALVPAAPSIVVALAEITGCSVVDEASVLPIAPPALTESAALSPTAEISSEFVVVELADSVVAPSVEEVSTES
jgi:hypothetical protein